MFFVYTTPASYRQGLFISLANLNILRSLPSFEQHCWSLKVYLLLSTSAGQTQSSSRRVVTWESATSRGLNEKDNMSGALSSSSTEDVRFILLWKRTTKIEGQSTLSKCIYIGNLCHSLRTIYPRHASRTSAIIFVLRNLQYKYGNWEV